MLVQIRHERDDTFTIWRQWFWLWWSPLAKGYQRVGIQAGYAEEHEATKFPTAGAALKWLKCHRVVVRLVGDGIWRVL